MILAGVGNDRPEGKLLFADFGGFRQRVAV